MDVFKSCKELQFGTCSDGEPHACSVKQRRGNCFIEEKGKLRGAVINKKVHWRKLGIQSMVTFHQLSCDSLSLDELLPGKEKIFFPPVGGSNITSSWRCKIFLFLLRSVLMSSGMCMRTPPSGLLTPF